jgi:hypothetical protein
MKAQYESVIDTLGVNVIWTQAKPPHANKAVTAGIKIAGNDDEALVQSLGVGARIFTMKASDFTTAPEKFDRLVVGTEAYTAEAVHPVHLNAALIGYRIYTKGK